MTTSTILDDVISTLQPEDLPTEYIVMAKVIDDAGVERILRGDDVTLFLNDPNRAQGISEARVILNMSKIRQTVVEVMIAFFEELTLRVGMLMPPGAEEA